MLKGFEKKFSVGVMPYSYLFLIDPVTRVPEIGMFFLQADFGFSAFELKYTRLDNGHRIPVYQMVKRYLRDGSREILKTWLNKIQVQL